MGRISWRHRNAKNKCFQKYEKYLQKRAEKNCVNIWQSVTKINIKKQCYKIFIRRKGHYKLIHLKTVN